jgi:hypothetical protein
MSTDDRDERTIAGAVKVAGNMFNYILDQKCSDHGAAAALAGAAATLVLAHEIRELRKAMAGAGLWPMGHPEGAHRETE